MKVQLFSFFISSYRAVVPPSIESALPEDIRKSNPDSASAWERGDGGGDEGGEGVLLLLAVHGGQGPTLLHAARQRVQPVKGGGGQLPALAGGHLGVADGASSDQGGNSCGGCGGRDRCHRGGRGRCSRRQTSGWGGSSAGDWSTSASKDSALDCALS